MAETLFAFDERNYKDCQTSYRGVRNHEYYLGDYSIESGSVINVRADKQAVGACSIIRLQSKTRLSFRRSWNHIREDAIDVAVLWFVKRGRINLSHQTGSTLANTGDFLITKSLTPFAMECQTDEESTHDVLHVIVPTPLLARFMPQELKTGFVLSAKGRELELAENLFTYLFEDAGQMEDDAAQALVNGALSLLSRAMSGREAGLPSRQTVSDRRLQDVLRYIEIHISDPKLSIAAVAKGCGISPRYLSFLLKLHGASFSNLVWERRLELAARWIASPEPAAISEIAYRAGFKSPAHFSRMFKRVFNMSPREYRVAGRTENVRRLPAPASAPRNLS